MGKSIEFLEQGLYVPDADIFIDPWHPVEKSIITHGHSDHARPGMTKYLTHIDNEPILKFRLGNDIAVQTLEYAESIKINNTKISLFPAGHILGSSQVLVETNGERWVISGDYKLEFDPTCEAFEPVKCDHFITESTFGLPVYHWKEQNKVFEEINHWWKSNQENGICSVLIGYALGKAQRIISSVDHNIGPIYTHGAVENLNGLFREMGKLDVPTKYANEEDKKDVFRNALVVAPPSAAGSSWLKKFAPYSIALTSGWMSLRGARRRRNVDKGFILSDHADWAGLNQAIDLTQAENIYVTHGYTEIFSQYLNEKGLNSSVVKTEYQGELVEIGEEREIE